MSLKQGSVVADDQPPQSLFIMKFQYNLTKGLSGCASRIKTGHLFQKKTLIVIQSESFSVIFV